MSTYVERLGALDTPCVSDALDMLGLPGAVSGLLPLTVRRRIVGPVRTVKLGPLHKSPPKQHLGAGAIMAAEPGDVIVLQHGRSDVSGWGGLLSRGAVARGVSGVIVDGALRDIDEALDLQFPIYGRCAVPFTARGRVAEHTFQKPIEIAGVAIRPGDLVLADSSGVVFVAMDRIEDVLHAAEDIAQREQLMACHIDQGHSIGEVLGASYEDMLLRTGATK